MTQFGANFTANMDQKIIEKPLFFLYVFFFLKYFNEIRQSPEIRLGGPLGNALGSPWGRLGTAWAANLGPT